MTIEKTLEDRSFNTSDYISEVVFLDEAITALKLQREKSFANWSKVSRQLGLTYTDPEYDLLKMAILDD